jgi:hypothetical protein
VMTVGQSDVSWWGDILNINTLKQRKTWAMMDGTWCVDLKHSASLSVI